jgi:hypothetical protein
VPGEVDWRDGGGQAIGGYYSDDPPRIGLSARVCAWLWLNLDGSYHLESLDAQAWAWHTFSHEIAHHLGYDHGERTVGADCIGVRRVGLVMRRAGQPQWWRLLVRHDLARSRYCARRSASTI